MVRGRLAGREEASPLWLEINKIANMLERHADAEPFVQSPLAEKGEKDEAYRQRNVLVAALARLYPSGTRRTNIEGWSEDWHGCVYIDLPAGQISYHYHDSQAYLFAALPAYEKPWDGSGKEQVEARLWALSHTEQQGWEAKYKNDLGNFVRLENWLENHHPEVLDKWESTPRSTPAAPERRDGHVALRVRNGKMEMFDPHPESAVSSTAPTTACDDLKRQLWRKYPDPLEGDKKLLYYMEAAESYGQLAAELEQRLSATGEKIK